MNKKNRFSMLEIKEQDKEKKIEPTAPHEPKLKDLKVIIENEEFERNLNKSKLKDSIVDIEKKKVELKEGIKIHKNHARLWFMIGAIIIIMTFVRYKEQKLISSTFDGIHNYRTVEEKVMTGKNYLIIIGLIVIFGIQYYASNKGKKK